MSTLKEFDVEQIFTAHNGAHLVMLTRKDIRKAATQNDAWKLYHVHGTSTVELASVVSELRTDELVLATDRGNQLRVKSENGSIILAEMNGQQLKVANSGQYRVKRSTIRGILNISITPRVHTASSS
ncbi:MAG: hypothetical protein EOO17_02455 [Chloroflexi bacterium]|nr:MAG: hypothetical protein EOO17_02455 [Chloroflexota bacterium]